MGNTWLVVATIAFTIMVFALIFTIDHLQWFVPLMMCLYGTDVVNAPLMRKNFRRYTDNPSFSPEGYHREFILRRRAVAEEYLFGHRYVTKAIIVITACAIALVFVHLPLSPAALYGKVPPICSWWWRCWAMSGLPGRGVSIATGSWAVSTTLRSTLI